MPKTKSLLIIIFLSLLGLILGKYLTKIYGIDPPNIYFWSGMILNLFSSLIGIITIILLIINFIKQKKGSPISFLY
ncbi:hypothetical protein B0I22_2144 [Epilithonimonas xixisoli]|uniref:Uncharacterized protein n=1 Tax=Epilithonimonas xixisoli TaxID=1476462 RepID=A0A4R8IB13_9FLAO|nr:hypothetical protein B0I22_2144 [Epilithonimonas xixisoli]